MTQLVTCMTSAALGPDAGKENNDVTDCRGSHEYIRARVDDDVQIRFICSIAFQVCMEKQVDIKKKALMLHT